MARLALALVLLPTCVLADGVCAADGTCRTDETENSALLQSSAARRARVGQHAISADPTCPGSGNFCNGNQCCPGYAGSGNKTFPCPNADADWNGCENASAALTQSAETEEVAMLQGAKDSKRRKLEGRFAGFATKEFSGTIVFCTEGQKCPSQGDGEFDCPANGICGQYYKPSPGPAPAPAPQPGPAPAPKPQPGYSGAYCNPTLTDPEQLCPSVPGYAPGPYPCPDCGSTSCACPR